MRIPFPLVGLLAYSAHEAVAFAPSRTSPTSKNGVDVVGGGWSAPQQQCKTPPVSNIHRQQRKHLIRLFMGWGPDPIWSTATIETNIQACPSGSCVSLKVNVDDGSDFIYPGQYVQVKPAGSGDDAKPIFLAIASAPTGIVPKPTPPGKKSVADEADAAAGPAAPIQATYEFLIKKTDNNDWITSATAGHTVSVSQVMGGGFPMQENLEGFKYDFPTQNILMFATGSGIAPIRSAIESNQLNIAKSNQGGRTCTLYYGVRSPDDMPYVSKFPQWEELGVQVVPVISQPDLGGVEWRGRTGYVQNALEEDGVQIPRNSGALLCGVKGMCEGVKSMLVESGVFEGRVFTNF